MIRQLILAALFFWNFAATAQTPEKISQFRYNSLYVAKVISAKVVDQSNGAPEIQTGWENAIIFANLELTLVIKDTNCVLTDKSKLFADVNYQVIGTEDATQIRPVAIESTTEYAGGIGCFSENTFTRNVVVTVPLVNGISVASLKPQTLIYRFKTLKEYDLVNLDLVVKIDQKSGKVETKLP